MSQLILLESDAGGVAICYPTADALETYTILEIALKDTPTGKPFWIVDKTEVSNDQTFFDAWELDLEELGEPTGYGMDYEDWAKEYKK